MSFKLFTVTSTALKRKFGCALDVHVEFRLSPASDVDNVVDLFDWSGLFQLLVSILHAREVNGKQDD